MKVRKLLLIIQCLICSTVLHSAAQTGIVEDFNDNILSPSWSGSTYYVETETNQELKVVVAQPAAKYNAFTFSFSALQLSSDPYVKLKIKTSSALRLRVDFEDINGNATNSSSITKDVASATGYQELTYNFTGRFTQSWPIASPVDPDQIVKIVLFVNPGGTAFNGTIYLDDISIGSSTGILPPPGEIKLNQVGFYPKGPKTGIIVMNSTVATPFYIISKNLQDTLYTGALGAPSAFSLTGETLRKADFTAFQTVGSYYLNVPVLGYSNPFEIKPAVHHAVSKAGLKGFYFQRASTALNASHAGIWARAKGHPDNNVLVHNSAENVYRPANTSISCPRGWYDAGDYNKYTITAGISTFMLLSMFEHYSTYFDTLNLAIPESNNSIPDVLDEALWEIRWLLTMQDPYDGGVYSKLTSPNFDGTVMPSASTQLRYVVKKSTPATLDFAATLAQSARVLKFYEAQLPGLADSCINASVKAWRWARKNRTEYYVQSLLTNPEIKTGEYGDNDASDEFQWAAMELYATTKIDSFYVLSGTLSNFGTPGWSKVNALGYLSLAHLRKKLTPLADTTKIKQYVLNLANTLKANASTCPYGTTMSSASYFNWGSNSNAATHGMLLLQAFDITKDSSYFKTAITAMDYLLGRNGTNYSFLTGYGTIPPIDIHHRCSAADGIDAPVPGLLSGGPNTESQSDCGGSSSYPSSYAAKSYLDAYCSYSTNEIAINWNAPFAYTSNVIEAIEAGGFSSVLNYSAILPSNTVVISDTLSIASIQALEATNFKLVLYPNPAKDYLHLEFSSLEKTSIFLTDISGRILLKKELNGSGDQEESINIETLKSGFYYLLLKSGSTTEARKVVVE